MNGKLGGSRRGNRNGESRRSVSGSLDGCARLCHCTWECRDGSAYGECSIQRRLEEQGKIAPGDRETVADSKPLFVCTHSTRMPSLANLRTTVPEEVGGRGSAVLVVGFQDAIAGELVDGGVLIELVLRGGDTVARDDLDVELNLLARMRHLLIRFGNVLLLSLFDWKHASLRMTRQSDSTQRE